MHFFPIWIDTKETCDVGVLKEGIAELKKRLEEDKLECAGTIGKCNEFLPSNLVT